MSFQACVFPTSAGECGSHFPAPLPPTVISLCSGLPASGNAWPARPGWPLWSKTSSKCSRARSWTTCGLTRTTWGFSSQTRESGDAAREQVMGLHSQRCSPSRSSGLTLTPCTGWMQPGAPRSSYRWRIRKSTVPTAPPATPR